MSLHLAGSIAFIFLVLLILPTIGAVRSIKAHERGKGNALVDQKRARVKLLVLLVLSPLLVGVTVLLVHPFSPTLAALLSAFVMIAASSYYFLRD